MSRDPRDPALDAMLGATVRVAEGSGVVIRNGGVTLIATANHVVRDGTTRHVRCGELSADCSVVTKHEESDLALLTAPPTFDEVALEIAGDSAFARVGDAVWASGFPRGWRGDRPLLARGAIAGFGDENWVNLDGTWGQSGGPLCRIAAGVPLVVGILLGNASDSSDELIKSREAFQRGRRMSEEMIGKADELLATRMQEPGGLFAGIQRLAALLFSQTVMAGGMVTELIDEHFRTGFLRFADASEIGKLL
jgi:hypothetical protein